MLNETSLKHAWNGQYLSSGTHKNKEDLKLWKLFYFRNLHIHIYLSVKYRPVWAINVPVPSSFTTFSFKKICLNFWKAIWYDLVYFSIHIHMHYTFKNALEFQLRSYILLKILNRCISKISLRLEDKNRTSSLWWNKIWADF